MLLQNFLTIATVCALAAACGVDTGHGPSSQQHLASAATNTTPLMADVLLSHTGRGIDVFGKERVINLASNESTDGGPQPYYLVDTVRNIAIYDAGNAFIKTASGLPQKPIASASDVIDDEHSRAAVSALYNLARVYDFYLDNFNQRGADGQSGQIKAAVHVGKNLENALSSPKEGVILFGDGNPTEGRPWSGALDVVGHEFTHIVVGAKIGLIARGESGALDEGLADTFGALAKFYYNDNPSWYLGKDTTINGGGLRDMAHPGSWDLPEHMSEYRILSSMNGGVHINSTIVSKTAYLISQGGTFHGINVTGLGTEKLGKIFYAALSEKLIPDASFLDFAIACDKAATTLYGADSTESKTVRDAFKATGITLFYTITHQKSHKVLTLVRENGKPLLKLEDFNGSDGQKWQLFFNDLEFFTIRSVTSRYFIVQKKLDFDHGSALEIADLEGHNGPIEMQTNYPLWRKMDRNGKTFVIRNIQSRQFIDVENDELCIRNQNDHDNQFWTIDTVSF